MMTLHNCRAGYGAETVLNDVSMEISPGRVTALIGPNGSGKSTLLRMAARLIRPEAGEIRLHGKDAQSYTRREYARLVAYLPQQRDVPALSVRALAAHGRYPHLSFPRAMSKADWEIVEDALARAGALPFANRDLRTLSGGERQRAYLAMALSQAGGVLLLDEPAAHLDAGCQFDLLLLLRALAQEGRAVLIALHDIAHALTFADEVAVLGGGRLVACAPPAEISPALLASVFGVRVVWAKAPDGSEHPLVLPSVP